MKNYYYLMGRYEEYAHKYKKGEIVFEDKSKLTTDCIILSGKMKEVFEHDRSNKAAMTMLYRENDVFGIMHQDPSTVFNTIGIAKTDLEILSFPEDVLFHLMDSDEMLRKIFLQGLFDTFSRLSNKYCAVSSLTPTQRVIEFLCSEQEKSLDGLVHMTTEEIAMALSTTRQTVSKTINDIKADGLLKSEYKKVKLLDIPTIQKLYGLKEIKGLND